MTPAEERREIGLALQRIGGPGGRLAARMLPLRAVEHVIQLHGTVSSNAKNVDDLAATLGDVVASSSDSVSWILHGGARNPAVVTVTLRAEKGGVAATVRAAAIEGLIPQHTGRKAATDVANRLLALKG